MNNLNSVEIQDYEHNIFIGTVVANDDPLQLERVKVTIPSLMEGEAAKLPWVAPFDRRTITNGGSHGSFGLVPSVGDRLLVVFQSGDPAYGYYMGSPIMTGSRPVAALVNYPRRYGFTDPVGNSFYVDTTGGSTEVVFSHVSGTTLRINNDGSITTNATVWNHTGDLNVTGTVTGTTDVIGGGKSLKNHRHGGVNTGGGQTGTPV